MTDTGTAYVISTAKARLTVTKSPITLRLQDASGAELLRETAPMAWNASGMTQTLARGAQEQFFGGGMQNGRFSHRDTDHHDHPRLQLGRRRQPERLALLPLSTAGYGVLRNTFAPGSYSFHVTVAPRTTSSGSTRTTSSATLEVLDRYTELTGRPFMLPMYGLEFGDSDCYLPQREPRRARDAARHDGHRRRLPGQRHAARLDAGQRRLRLRLRGPPRDRTRCSSTTAPSSACGPSPP